MSVQHVCTREDDERLLDWLYLLDAGWSSPEIGRRYGVAATRVRAATNRVKNA
jgi:hypothetical protein